MVKSRQLPATRHPPGAIGATGDIRATVIHGAEMPVQKRTPAAPGRQMVGYPGKEVQWHLYDDS